MRGADLKEIRCLSVTAEWRLLSQTRPVVVSESVVEIDTRMVFEVVAESLLETRLVRMQVTKVGP